MAIKQTEILSRADFDEAVVKLRLNVSEIAKETGIPRTYISEFRNGDRKLRPELLGKLRDYFEAKGIEFEAEAPASAQSSSDGLDSPHPSLATGTVLHFPVRGDLPAARIQDVLGEIEVNEARVSALLAEPATRKASALGFDDTDEYSEATQDALRELFARLSANQVLIRYLLDSNSVLDKPVKKDTLAEVLIETVRESAERAGALEQATAEPEDGPEDEE